MPTAKVYNMAGEEISTIELSEAVFGIEPNESVLHDSVKNYLANQRQGTQSTLTRTEVSGGGKKPWRQKGTGHARQGSRRGPQWTKGGLAFALKPRDFSQKVNKTAKRVAFCSAISKKIANNDVFVVENFNLQDHKTKTMKAVLDAFKINKSALIVLDQPNENVMLSSGNLNKVLVENYKLINVYQIVCADKILITQDAIKSIEEAYAE